MGADALVTGLSPIDVEQLVEQVHLPALSELADRGAPFVGVRLYAGPTLTPTGPRCSSSTAASATPRPNRSYRSPRVTWPRRCTPRRSGTLRPVALATTDSAAVTVVLASGDYPASGDRGSPIDGIEAAEATGALVFHAGTALHDGVLVTNGGRVLAVTGRGETPSQPPVPPPTREPT